MVSKDRHPRSLVLIEALDGSRDLVELKLTSRAKAAVVIVTLLSSLETLIESRGIIPSGPMKETIDAVYEEFPGLKERIKIFAEG